MWLSCPECREESAFEQPPCEEGHGLDCPEWFCVTCGSAVFAGAFDAVLFVVSTEPGPARRASRHHAA